VSSSWIPGWVAVAWVLAYAAIGLGHLIHVVAMSGGGRAWHAAHALMAAGMIDMFWPWGGMPFGAGSGEAAFALATAGYLVLTGVARRKAARRFWLPTAAGLALMSYMFALMSLRYLVVITVLLAAWQLAEAMAWATGRRGLRGEGAAVRISLALMSAGMAYMLLAMQFGMAAGGPAGPSMPGMPGM